LRDETQRLDRASQAAMRGERFRDFMADGDVAAFFAAYERDHIERMLKAGPGEDDTRRDAALAISAMREFRAFIHAAILAGARASETLRKENTT